MVSKGHASRKLDMVILPYLGPVVGHSHRYYARHHYVDTMLIARIYLASHARLPLANRYHTVGAILSLVRHT